MKRDRLPPGSLRLLAVVALAAGAIVLAILVRRYGADTMKRLAVLAIAAVALSGCASAFDPVKFADAANTLDPQCGKRVEINVTPVLLFGWPVPVVSGKYVKECEKAPAP